MQGVERVEIKGHQSDGGESGCDFSGHDSAFAHTFDHKLGFAISAQLQQCQAFFDLIASEMFRRWGNGSCLLPLPAGSGRVQTKLVNLFSEYSHGSKSEGHLA